MATGTRRATADVVLALVGARRNDPTSPSVTVMVSCTGDFDRHSAPTLQRALERAVRLRPDLLIVDLAGVTHMDAGTVEQLLDARRDLPDPAALCVREPARPWRRALADLGVAEFVDTDERALAPMRRVGTPQLRDAS